MSLRFSSLLASAALCSVSFAAPAAVLFNEDFSSGLATGTTASSDYALTPTGVFTVPGSTGVYRVVSDPENPTFTNFYAGYYDHTSGTSNGAMLFFDGSPSSDRIFYRSASLTAGSSYTFSYWVSAADTLNTPEVFATLDGVQLGGTTSSTSGAWTQASVTFVAAATGLATFGIVDAALIDEGNDGALDDITLVGPDVVVPPQQGVPEPGVGALLAMGLGVAGFTRRRRIP